MNIKWGSFLACLNHRMTRPPTNQLLHGHHEKRLQAAVPSTERFLRRQSYFIKFRVLQYMYNIVLIWFEKGLSQRSAT